MSNVNQSNEKYPLHCLRKIFTHTQQPTDRGTCCQTKYTTIQHHPKPQRQHQVTVEARAQIPNGPSNIDSYLAHEEIAEDIVMGQLRQGTEEHMARELAEWDSRWKASSNN